MSTDSTPAIARTIGDLLREREATLAVAESSTGGLVGSMVTDVPGSSEYFDRSLVTYANRAKMDLLDVSQETIAEHGAVSEPTARAMAIGVRENAGTDWGLSTTGVAGPGGGSERTPVGTLYVGVAQQTSQSSRGSDVRVERFEFDGDRLENKHSFATQALRELERSID